MTDGSGQIWVIYRKTPRADIFLGRVKARDEQAAISLAIEKLAVTNRHHQRALIARKVEAMDLDDGPEFCA